MRFAALLWCLWLVPAAAQYSAQRAGELIRLEDARSQTAVAILPSVGNMAVEMKVKGHNVLRFPFASLADFQSKPGLAGIPLLAPWANRLDEAAFYANGKKYFFQMDSGAIRLDAFRHPIHGFLSYASQWEVVEVQADGQAAWSTSRLEVFRQPAWMAQFPFAHTIEMTYRLEAGALEVATRVRNQSAEPLPVALGYHPFFQLTDAPRDDWTIGIGARTEWVLSKELIPTGETRPIERLLPKPQAAGLRGLSLDHVFGDLVRDASGRATLWVQGKSQKVEVVVGPNYRAAVVYAPPGPNREFICFEPMAGITNALNLAHRGLYKELQTIPAGGTWRESFWVRPGGF